MASRGGQTVSASHKNDLKLFRFELHCCKKRNLGLRQTHTYKLIGLYMPDYAKKLSLACTPKARGSASNMPGDRTASYYLVVVVVHVVCFCSRRRCWPAGSPSSFPCSQYFIATLRVPSDHILSRMYISKQVQVGSRPSGMLTVRSGVRK